MRLLALLLAFGLVAAACGDSDDDSGDGATEETSAPDEADGGDEGDDAAVDDEAGTRTGEVESEEETRYGGTLRYGLEAETNTGWTPSGSNCAIACHQVMRSFFDPLTTIAADGSIVPFLAQSVLPLVDEGLQEGQVPYGVWEIKLRDQEILFHNGDPLTAEAVAANLLDHTDPTATTFTAVILVNSVDVIDESTVHVSMSLPGGEPGTFPWVAFDAYLGGTIGYIAHPSQLEAEDGAQNPIGTGAFVFESWTPNEQLNVVRNENYWRTDPDGNALPYLDRIEYLPLPEATARTAALESGQIDILHTSNGDEIAGFQGQDDLVVNLSDQFGETTYLMFNHSAELIDGSPNPVTDARIRRALAHCFDRELFIDLRDAGLRSVANTPFTPGTLGHLDDTGFPGFDPEAGIALVAEWEAENGDLPPLEIGTTSDPFNLGSVELMAQFFGECGIDVEIIQIEQGQFITEALLGNFQINFWRNHAGVDPDQQFLWWHSSANAPLGEIAVNFGRINDPVIDELLGGIRTLPDPAVRQELAENLSRQMAAEVTNLWISWTLWANVYDAKVQNITVDQTPEGVEIVPTGVGIGGTHSLSQIFIVE